jgi:hypothetical protein
MNNSALRPLLYRWFVQFNPFFTASALCVLGGVLVLSRALGTGSERGLTLVVELYQWLLIGVAGVLYRRLLERRPAAILGLIAVVFAMDPTLQVSALSGAGSVFGVTLWLLSFAAKVRALVWAFRLRVSDALCTLPVIGAGLVAALPLARVASIDDSVVRVVLAWSAFAFTAVMQRVNRSVSSTHALDEYGSMMFARIVKATGWIAVAGAGYQIANACFAISPVTVLLAVGGSVLAIASRMERTEDVIANVVIGVVVCAAGGDVRAALPLAGLVLLFASRRSPFLALVTVLALHRVATAAVPAFDHPGIRIAGDLFASAALIALVVRHRSRWMLGGLPVLNHAWAVPALRAIASFVVDTATATSARGWGGLLLIAGFALLPLGVVVHRKLSRSLAEFARTNGDNDGDHDGGGGNGDRATGGDDAGTTIEPATSAAGFSAMQTTEAPATNASA